MKPLSPSRPLSRPFSLARRFAPALLVWASLSLSLSACAASYAEASFAPAYAESGAAYDAKEAAPEAPMAAKPLLLDPSDASGASSSTSSEKPIEAAKRLVIYTGRMSLIVPDGDRAVDAFVAEVNGLGGYLQSRAAQTVTVRVPAEQFFAVVATLRTRGQVTEESINADDVTKKVFDIELRLQVADESRKRLLALLQQATKVEDILRIETEIRRLTDEIEGMKGELRNLNDQIAFSTLTVNFYANAPSPRRYPERTQSRFPWINEVGVERVLGGF